MADSSLDDFFAKKDKSKKKSKSKMAPADVLSKADEAKKVKKKKAQEKTGGLGLSIAEQQQMKREEDDEEWKDFEEQKEVDYSGLRIHTLQIREDEEKEAAESEEGGDGEDGEEGREGASGPWNKSTGGGGAAPAQPTPAPATEPEEKKETTAPKKYVPPAQRMAATMAAANVNKRGKKEAPNIQSEDDFPTLGGGPGGPSTGSTAAWGARRYEDSAAGDIESNPGQRRGASLSLENKYAALQD